MNLRVLVCRECLDVPQEQLRPRILTADPLPVQNARFENYNTDDNTFLTIETMTPTIPGLLPFGGFVLLVEAGNSGGIAGNQIALGIATNPIEGG